MVRLVIAMTWEKELKHTTILLGVRTDFSIIGAATDSYQALHMVESEQPDIIILDYHLGNIKSWDLIPTIKRKSPATSVIIISPYDDEIHARGALRRGASGYLVRKFDMGILTGIIYIVYTGGRYVSYQIVAQILAKLRVYQERHREIFSKKRNMASMRPRNFITFSDTELRIIGFISQGRSTKEIAENLNLKTGTIRNYISRLIHKTGGRSRAQMIFSALGGGPVEM
jgi:DNA-binding NarL/FixJ family response regulator